MKKTIIWSALGFLLVACTEVSSSSIISGDISSSPSSSEGLPNNLQPLIAVDSCPVQTIDNHWVCVWNDEFDGDSLNSDHWNIEVNGDGGGNQELQYYRAENIVVEDGLLAITAKMESYLGKNYTSGRINSRDKVDTKYGRVVIRAKMPGGRGTWAALWMLPLFNRYGGWPNSGEIDILEYVGYDENRIHTAIHTKKFNHKLNNNIVFSRSMNQVNVEESYVDYEMIWAPGSIRILADGVQYGTFNYVPQFNQDVEYHEAYPFDQDFFFVINLAIGGSWGGVQGVDNSIFPTTMFVDHIRLYKFDYAVVDVEAPLAPTNVAQASILANTFHWNRAVDDYDIETYAIYLDGEFYRFANLNQFTFKTLEKNRSYDLQVQAVDFTGRVSPLTAPLSFTFI